MVDKMLVGRITHFFDKISVVVIELSDTIRVGDRISVEGANTDFEQDIKSMEIDRKPIKEATAGQMIGTKVVGKARPGDNVYLIVE